VKEDELNDLNINIIYTQRLQKNNLNLNELDEEEVLILKLSELWLDKIHELSEKRPYIRFNTSPISNEESINPPTVPIILKNLLKKKLNPSKKRSNEAEILFIRHSSEKLGSRLFVGNLSGKMLTYNLYNQIFNNDFNSFLFTTRITEAALVKIIILDERYIDYFYNLYDPDIDVESTYKQETFYNIGVFFPCELNINCITTLFTSKYKKQTSFKSENEITYTISTNLSFKLNLHSHKSDDFVINTLVIHQSIVEKCIENLKEIEQSDFLIRLKSKFPSVIITSGRNKSHKFKNFKFISSSIIETSIMNDCPDKYLLITNLLNTKL
jgi:hypothetical protein